MRDAEIAVVWDAHLGGRPVALIGIESRPLPRHGLIPADGPEQWTSGTLFPRVVEEDRARDQRRQRPPAARRARQPRGLRRLAGVDARVAARVRRRDRPRGRQLRRPDRVLRRLALPRRRVRGVLAAAQRAARGGRARGLARVGDRRRAGRRGRVRARRRAGGSRATRASSRSTSGSRPPTGAERQRLRAERAALWDDVLSEKRGELAAEFDAVHSVERAVRDGLGAAASSRRRRCARSSSTPSSAACSARSTDPRSR